MSMSKFCLTFVFSFCCSWIRETNLAYTSRLNHQLLWENKYFFDSKMFMKKKPGKFTKLPSNLLHPPKFGEAGMEKKVLGSEQDVKWKCKQVMSWGRWCGLNMISGMKVLKGLFYSQMERSFFFWNMFNTKHWQHLKKNRDKF